MNDEQLQTVVSEGQRLSDAHAAEGRFLDSMIVAGLVQAVRGLRSKFPPPAGVPVEPTAAETKEP